MNRKEKGKERVLKSRKDSYKLKFLNIIDFIKYSIVRRIVK